MLDDLKSKIVSIISAGYEGKIEFKPVPKKFPYDDLGDIAIPCFLLKNKNEPQHGNVLVANSISFFLNECRDELTPFGFKKAKATGPYINIHLDENKLAELVLKEVNDKKYQYGFHNAGKGKYIFVEYGCLNVLKAMHLGHLKNLITGEAVARLMENSGYKVKRITYQGDVGMHIGKAMWGIMDWFPEFEAARELPVAQRVDFLNKAYAHGAKHYEKGDKEKEEVVVYNDYIYDASNEKVTAVYEEARQWSLEYLEEMYQKLGTKYDGYYFESQMYKRGIAIVDEFTKKGVFRKSEGAIIFPGSEYGLHDRVFINSKGHPTYEAKDLARSEMYFNETPQPEQVIHVVGKDQTEYFKVVFKAMETMGVVGAGKESHLIGGDLQLKGDKKMSSRTGNIITGDALIAAVEEAVGTQMAEAEAMKNKDIQKASHHAVSMAALKYAMLRANVSQDVAFDMEESVSVSGDSGPYLLYIVARIKSIQKKAEGKAMGTPTDILSAEKNLLLELASYPTVTANALADLDPSHIAKYLFTLAQAFNTFYHEAQVVDETGKVNQFRLELIKAVEGVMIRGLHILGIETVEAM